MQSSSVKIVLIFSIVLLNKNMRAILILLLGFTLTDAVTHSYGYIYTETTGIAGFPEFVSVGLVDGQQVSYFDTHSMKMVPRTDWVSGAVDPDFWNRNAQNFIATHQAFKNNIEKIKQRFNQTGGVHLFQKMYGCKLDDDGTKQGYMQFGYDGEDFISFDKSTLTWTASNPQAAITKNNWDSTREFTEIEKLYLDNICIEWLNKYVDYGKDTLKRKVSPQVSLLQKTPSSPVSCHATGFYPSGITISWQRNGREHHEDVDLGELLPNADGTFQKTSTLSVTPDELKKNKFSCVVEHQGETKTEDEIRTNGGDSVPIGIIVGALAAVVLLILIGVAGYVYKKKQGFKPVSGSDDGSNSSAQAVPQA